MNIKQIMGVCVSFFVLVVGCAYTPPDFETSKTEPHSNGSPSATTQPAAGDAAAAASGSTPVETPAPEATPPVPEEDASAPVVDAEAPAVDASTDTATATPIVDAAVDAVVEASVDAGVDAVADAAADTSVVDAASDSGADSGLASDGSGLFRVRVTVGAGNHSFTVFIASVTARAGEPTWGVPTFTASSTNVFDRTVKAFPLSTFIVQGYWDPPAAPASAWTNQLCVPSTLTLASGVVLDGWFQNKHLSYTVVSNGAGGCNIRFVMPSN